MRLVSLACSNTEILHALGMANHLVGVDNHSDHPAELLQCLPRLGPELDIDVARVADLRPDLVLASLSVPGHEAVVRALEEAGLPILVLDPICLAEVFRDIRAVARRVEVPERGAAVVEEMQSALRSVAERSRRSPDGGKSALHFGKKGPGILIQWWPKPVIAPGRQSWVRDLLDIAGAVSPLAEEDVRSRPLSDEEVAEMAPDAIVLSWCGVSPSKYRPDVVQRNPLWQEVPALRNGQIHCVPEAYLGRPGPRLVEGARALARVVDSMVTKAPSK
jgi:iron complex transport system substrate-binding protein